MLRKETLASDLICLDDSNRTWTWKIVPVGQALLGNVLLQLRQSNVIVTMQASVTDGNGQYPFISTLRVVYQAIAQAEEEAISKIAKLNV
jgi:hypothetical protein